MWIISIRMIQGNCGFRFSEEAPDFVGGVSLIHFRGGFLKGPFGPKMEIEAWTRGGVDAQGKKN